MADDFRSQLDRVADWIDGYYRDARRYPVLSRNQPGEVVAALPHDAPEDGESFDAIFKDFENIIVPGITHWNHPRFFAYFSISAAPVTVLAEMLAATLDVNAMLWRTSPAATELEDVVTAWMARLLKLPAHLHGIVYDTASTGGFTALAAARQHAEPSIRMQGMLGRKDLAPLRVYITDHTHNHLEKGAVALGLGRDNVVRVPVDERFRMRPEALDAAVRADRAAGMRPMAVCATVGTTGVTASDDLIAIAEVAKRHGAWLHVDAAYAGPAAILPEIRPILNGVEFADSLVVNPHKWLFVPVDLSILYVRDLENLRATFSLEFEILKTTEQNVHNYMDYGLQLGRRFRALKLWFLLRYYGAKKVREKLRSHIALAQDFAQWVDADPAWEVIAPHPLSVVVFRYVGSDPASPDLDAINQQIADDVNASGEAFISSTKLGGRAVLRIAIGNERTTRDDVLAVWNLLQKHAPKAVARA